MATVSENNKAMSDIFPAYILDEFIEWIVKNMPVEDVYPESVLNQWAKDNDWIKIENS
jgi:hypothetical protein